MPVSHRNLRNENARLFNAGPDDIDPVLLVFGEEENQQEESTTDADADSKRGACDGDDDKGKMPLSSVIEKWCQSIPKA